MSGNTLRHAGRSISLRKRIRRRRTRRQERADVYERLGISGTGRPFRRVFPIGRRTGVDNMVFGDGSPDGVYRGMGRGLGRLLLSGFDNIISYLIANVAGGLLSTDTVAWGSKADYPIWSSLFRVRPAILHGAEIRYLEYAQERIARSSVKHVLDGFRQEGEHARRSAAAC